jgi:hypothetical protein
VTDDASQESSARVTWVDILIYDTANPLTRYCIIVSGLAVLGWLLVRMLTP